MGARFWGSAGLAVAGLITAATLLPGSYGGEPLLAPFLADPTPPLAEATPTEPSTGTSPEGLPLPATTVRRDAEADARVRSSDDALRSRIERTLPTTRFPGSEWAVLAVSLQHGDTLFARNADLPLAPASNMKVLTSAAALHYLGSDFRFPTYVITEGAVQDGVLTGDLVLYGTGDPALSDRFHSRRTEALEALAQELRNQGIHRIEGDVVGDGSFFQEAGVPGSWDPNNFNNAYSAPVSALSFNENVVTLRVGPGLVPGTPARVQTIPEEVDLPIVNDATTVDGPPGRPLIVDRGRFEDSIQISGNLRVGAPEAWRVIPVGDPTAFAASVFRNVLFEEGIVVSGRSRGLRDDTEGGTTEPHLWAPRFRSEVQAPRVLAVHRSPPLLDLLEVVNKRSNNLYAELIFLALGQAVLADGTFDGGRATVQRFLERVVGLDVSEIQIEDGSGLSRENRVSARHLVAVLDFMETSPHGEAFWSTLPEAGNPRELRRMYQTAAAGNLRAKTGTIRRASALSGIVQTRSGEPVLFSIIGNEVPSPWAFKRIEDEIGAELAGFRRSSPPVGMPLPAPR